MASFTRQAIKAAFLKLLNERPLAQITVKDIVETCGINRNSFYYHFDDIPSLLEVIVTEEADAIIEKYTEFDSIEQCFEAVVRFAIENKRAVYHIYNSANRQLYERYLLRICEHVVKKYFDSVLAESALSDEDKEIIIRFFKCTCFGQIIEWLEGGMKDDIISSFNRLCELRRGEAKEFFLGSKQP